jgi:hypothetical protein
LEVVLESTCVHEIRIAHFLTADVFLIRLMGGGLLKPKKRTLGADIAGRVAAVGKNIRRFQPSDEVFGANPRWSRDGRELFFVAPAESDGGRRLMSVPIDPESGAPVDDPRELFSLDALSDGAEPMATFLMGRRYNVSPDGQGFVMVLRKGEVRGKLRMMHIQNWTRALLQAEQGGR